MNSEELPIPAVGAQLVQASEDWTRSAGEILTELFPYVFESSKRMSTRAISRWLEETHGIKISQPTISRALRKPEKYWQPFAELMQPHARIVERAAKPALSEFMADERLFEWAIQDDNLEFNGNNADEVFADRNEIGEAIHYLREHWFCLSDTTRAHMNHYFEDESEEAENIARKEKESK